MTLKLVKGKTAVAYARFSTNLQNDRSIEDQVTLCEKLAERHGYKITKVYSDRALSSATMFGRTGLLSMITDLEARKFDAIISECLDRISGDTEDLAGIYKRCKFYDAKLITSSEGEANDISVGVRGIFGPMRLKDMADKVRRSLSGRVKSGMVPGKPPYGYRTTAEKMKPEPHPEHAAVVHRIFCEYVAGKRIRDICAGLTRDGVPTPSGGRGWSHTSIIGGGHRHTGIISNRLYIGVLVWDTHTSMRNPKTGNMEKRVNPDGAIESELPHLRIIDQELWDRAQALRAQRNRQREGIESGPRQSYSKSADRLLSGMLCCGECGGHMRIVQRGPRVGCMNARKALGCAHIKTYDLAVLEATVLNGIEHKLDLNVLTGYIEGYAEESERQQKSASVDRDAIQKKLNRVQVRIARIINVMDEVEDLDELKAELKALSREKAGLTEQLKLAEAGISKVRVHPEAISQFRATIEDMRAALVGLETDADDMTRARIQFRAIFDRFVVTPTGKRQPYKISAVAKIAAVLGVSPFPTFQTPEEMLKEQGLTKYGFGSSREGDAPKTYNEDLVCIGSFEQAA